MSNTVTFVIMTSETTSQCHFGYSDFSSRQIDGIAGDDIMFTFYFYVAFPWLVQCEATTFSQLRARIWSLLAKIGMEFGKYNRLTMCGCVCVGLSVCNRHDESRMIRSINTKLGPRMYLCCGEDCILFSIDDVDDVIRSKKYVPFELP